MSRPVRLSALAARDLQQARDWFDGQEPGLGDAFLERARERNADDLNLHERHTELFGDRPPFVARERPGIHAISDTVWQARRLSAATASATAYPQRARPTPPIGTLARSDQVEHRGRVEPRTADIAGHRVPDVAGGRGTRLPRVGPSAPRHRYHSAECAGEREGDCGRIAVQASTAAIGGRSIAPLHG